VIWATEFVACDINLMSHAFSLEKVDPPHLADELISEVGGDGVEVKNVGGAAGTFTGNSSFRMWKSDAVVGRWKRSLILFVDLLRREIFFMTLWSPNVGKSPIETVKVSG
jgi:hypothetical protein